MRFDSTDIAGLMLVTLQPHQDSRGSFTRLYCEKSLRQAGVQKPVTQINHSITRERGSLRGLHFQYPPASEIKIIRCLQGAVWDVALDLRKASPTFLQWRAFELTAANQRMVLIPEGFAHGFQTLADNTELLYLHTGFYTPEKEGGFSCFDDRLQIQWPLPVTAQSERDRNLPCVPDDFQGMTLGSGFN